MQGIKRGIVELADLIVVNKADGAMLPAAARAVGDYQNALHFLRPRSLHWQVPVVACSALENLGIDRLWSLIEEFKGIMTAQGDLPAKRAAQARQWLWSETADHFMTRLREDPALRSRMQTLESAVSAGQLSPRVAAHELVTTFWKNGADK